MGKYEHWATVGLGILLFSCGGGEVSKKQLVVKNTMDIEREFETVSVPIPSIGITDYNGTLVVMDTETRSKVVSQQIDNDGDGKMDELLFQPKIPANSEKVFEILFLDEPMEKDSIPACYSRFVPERTDDYAWENNRVAFRTYGPTAQKMIEDGVEGGTLSSGIDALLKRVGYPIIDKWYHKELETEGSYHEDNGEGLDNFHVGVSRGVGGVAKKVDTTYYVSRNFISWKTLGTGPIRTSFILAYADWDAAGNPISEEKRISLDYGSNLSRFEITLKRTDTISAGLTLHEKDGEIRVEGKKGWISYWEPHDGSELGTGIVIPGNAMIGHEHYLTDSKDKSNLYAHIRVKDSKVLYYAGFGWKKSGQFATKEEWESYLDTFSECLENPLEVMVKP